MTDLDKLQTTLETRLRDVDPGVELVALERPTGDSLRLFIDSPDGVDLALCERVTQHLGDLLEEFTLEVSSPGTDRPLTKPEHYRRFLGRRVRVRTREPIGGRRSFTGELIGADEASVRIDPGEGEVTIPLDGVRRSNLVPEFGIHEEVS